VVIPPLLPECLRLLWANHLGDESFYLARRLRAVVEVPHVAFRNHPVAEVRAAKDELVALGVDEMLALCADESCLSGERKGEQKKQGYKSDAFHDVSLLGWEW